MRRRNAGFRAASGGLGYLYQLNFAAGTHDLTGAGFAFARTGTGWDRNGASFAANTPRVMAGVGMLLEGARTNICTRSAEVGGAGFWTINGTPTLSANARAAPNGATEADDLTCDVSNEGYYSRPTITSSTRYTASAFFQHVAGTRVSIRFGWSRIVDGATDVIGVFNSTTALWTTVPSGSAASGIIDAPDPWFRPWWSVTSGAAVVAGGPLYYSGPEAGSLQFSVWGFQYEVGDFPSSPIPTAGSTVTRNAETCVASRAPTSGTMILRARTAYGVSGNQVLWQADDGTANNRVTIRRDSSRALIAEAVVSGSSVATLTLGTVADDSAVTVGFSFAANSFGASLNGAAPVTDTVGAMPTLTTERLGHSQAAGSEWYGPIGLAELYPTRLADSVMQVRTAQLALEGQGGTAALMSDQAADMVGINTHIAFAGTVYDTGYASIVKPRLLELGVRHIRDAPGPAGETTYRARYLDLANNGIDILMINWPEDGRRQDYVEALNALYGGLAVEAVEPPNERDKSWASYDWGEDWAITMQDYMEYMYAAYKGDPDLDDIVVLGPSFADSANAAIELDGVMPNATDYMDAGNVHNYSGTYPESSTGGGWGLSIDTVLSRYDNLSAGKPIWITENGYKLTGATEGHGVVTERASAKYLPRQFLYHLARGVPRYYIYELLNEAAENFAILDNDGTPRESFVSVKNFIALFSDPGEAFTPGVLVYGLTGIMTNIHTMLFQKRNGRFYLVLWQGVASHSGGATDGTATDVEPTARALTLTLGQSFTTINQFEPSFGTSAIATASNASSASLSVKDHILVVELIP